MSNVVVLSRDLFLKLDLLTLLRFGWAVNKEALIAVFKKHNIDIKDEKDLENLAKLHKEGKDKNGSLKDENGVPMVFDVVAILASEDKATEEQVYSALEQGRLVFV